jgi:hypothetical protein
MPSPSPSQPQPQPQLLHYHHQQHNHHNHHHHQQQQQQLPPLSVSPLHESTAATRPAAKEPAVARELSAEDHLTKGIECHERGSLQESTYHLRLAAHAKHPTAMLLYALACRHGWGMRPNAREGVRWLRAAADLVGLEVADDDARATTTNTAAATSPTASAGPAAATGAAAGAVTGAVSGAAAAAAAAAAAMGPADLLAAKQRRAQFALSIFELGRSFMNGWGVEQDRALAVRCFEIAGCKFFLSFFFLFFPFFNPFFSPAIPNFSLSLSLSPPPSLSLSPFLSYWPILYIFFYFQHFFLFFYAYNICVCSFFS